ncbi:MAG: CheR family methyltransferase [Anaeromyxobacter sp.]
MSRSIFQLLAALVKSRHEEGRGRLRFWSAASSSGEEAYTMAITIADTLADAHVDWRILGTDISTRILVAAEAATYPLSALRDVPKQLRSKYFHPLGSKAAEDPLYQVRDALRKHVTFKRLNLSTPPFPMRGPLDAVFCRNVMIYFDQRVRQGLVSAIEALMAPDGIFFVGHAETLNGLSTRFRALRPSVYVLPDAPHHSIEKHSSHAKGHQR